MSTPADTGDRITVQRHRTVIVNAPSGKPAVAFDVVDDEVKVRLLPANGTKREAITLTDLKAAMEAIA